MRTTIDLPEALYRQIKAKAALEGVPMKALVQRLVERGLAGPPSQAPARARSALPTLSIGHALPPAALSNAGLFELAADDD